MVWIGLAGVVFIGAVLLFISLGWEEDIPATPTVAPTPTPTPTPDPFQIVNISGYEMVVVPAVSFEMGAESSTFPDQAPVHTVYLDEFYIDRYEVTNKQFAFFVEDTGYRTDAEKLGYSFDARAQDIIDGADWLHPAGPRTDIDGLEDHPVLE
jgi:formylglycine-generating enzyme required for sulfatase activity